MNGTKRRRGGLLLALLSFFSLTVTGSGSENTVLYLNKGENRTLSCGSVSSGGTNTAELAEFQGEEIVEWILPGRANLSNSTDSPDEGNRFSALVNDDTGDLMIVHAGESAEGLYSCIRGSDQYNMEVRLRRIPDRVINLTVITHSIYATVSWGLAGRSEVDGFLCLFRNDTSHLKQVHDSDLAYQNSSRRLGRDSRTCDLYGLKPNHTYFVKVAAYNAAGVGDYVSAMLRTSCTLGFLEVSSSETRTAVIVGVCAGVLCLGTVSALAFLVGWYVRNRLYPGRQVVVDEEDGLDESVELMPQIILNPAFNIEMLENISPDFNENSEHAFLVDRRR